jgi:hypothetical protein
VRSLGDFITILILAACFLATAGFLYLVSQEVEFTPNPPIAKPD